MAFWKKKSFKDPGILSPDEILLDAANIPGFSRERFEGTLERPIPKGAYYLFGILLFLFGGLLISRTLWLQVVRGEELFTRSQTNFIEKTYIEPPRGIIFDRHGKIITSNEIIKTENNQSIYRRSSIHPYAFSHIMGFVGSITEEDIENDEVRSGIQKIGKSGIEFFYNNRLTGTPGEQDEEINAEGTVIAKGLLRPVQEGESVHTTIDAELQIKLWEVLDAIIRERNFQGGAGIIFSTKDGAILSAVSAPSFDINAFARGLQKDEAYEIFNDKRAPLFNRNISGLYAPGSIIKPFIALAALEERVINPEKEIFSSGALEIPDPYREGEVTIFKDWRAHGYTNMQRALAVSSDVYFYTIGGGDGDIAGLGIGRIRDWLERFGFNTETNIDLSSETEGHIPDPESKAILHPNNPDWRLGDTYNVSIGQGDLLVTPLEVARGLSILANNGNAVTPYIVEKQSKDNIVVVAQDESWLVINEGMIMAAQEGGTAAGVAGLPFKIAAKTGTAEVHNKQRVNSWFIGYTPENDSELGIVIFLEAGPASNLVGATSVAREIFLWIAEHGGITRLMSD